MLKGYIKAFLTEEKQNVDLQRTALLSADVDIRNIFTVIETDAVTDKNDLEKLINSMETGDCLVVWSLDRLGSSLHDLFSILTHLRKQGIYLRSLSEKIDTEKLDNDLFYNFFKSLVEYEKSSRRKKIMSGHTVAKKKGVEFGRPKLISESIIEEIKTRLSNGETKKSIQESLGIARSTFYWTLKNYNLN